MNESQAQAKILYQLRKHGWFYKASDRFRAGIPDIIGCYKGCFVAIEMKVDYNKASKIQEYEMSKIKEAGWDTPVITYSNREKVYKICNLKFAKPSEIVDFVLKHALSTIKSKVST